MMDKWTTMDKISDELDLLEKSELVEALDEVGLHQSALNLCNWDELDNSGDEFLNDLTKAIDDEQDLEELEKKYIGFGQLKSKLAHKKGVYDPAGLAAAIGRKKYGKKKFQEAAADDDKMNKAADTKIDIEGKSFMNLLSYRFSKNSPMVCTW